MHVLFQGDSHEDGTSGLARRCFGRKRIDATETSVDVKGDGRGRRVGHEHDETATTTAATARRTGSAKVAGRPGAATCTQETRADHVARGDNDHTGTAAT